VNERLWRRGAAAVLAVTAALAIPAAGAGQELACAPAAKPALLLPGEHWTVEAIRRGQALGLISTGSAQRSVTRGEAARAFAEAVRTAAEREPRYFDLAIHWCERFHAELAPGHRVVLRARTELITESGSVSPGLGSRPTDARPATGPSPRAELTDVLAATALTVAPTRFLAAAVEPRLRGADLDIGDWEVAGEVGPMIVSLGRQPVGYGGAVGGGLVLAGSRSFQGARVQTSRAVRLPAISRVLGPTSVHAFVSRLEDERHPDRPFFTGLRTVFIPHQRLEIAAQRAAIVETAGDPLRPSQLGWILLGETRRGGNAHDDQTASLAFRYRLPTRAELPLVLYGEWGWNDFDVSAALYDVPAVQLGILAPALPPVPALGVGLELTHFAPSCCGNPLWYRHWGVYGGWAVDDGPLGHPLGGHGTEVLGFLTLELPSAGLRLRGTGYARHRGFENQYAPDRAGKSVGGSARSGMRAGRGELFADLRFERAGSWTERAVSVGWTGTVLTAGKVREPAGR
jgi:hypothetical protein